MKILITGVAGFIGMHLAKELLKFHPDRNPGCKDFAEQETKAITNSCGDVENDLRSKGKWN